MVTPVGFSPNQGWSRKCKRCFACAYRCTTRSCIASFLSAMPYLQFRYYRSGLFVSLQVGLTSSNCGNTQYDLALSRSRSIRCFVLAVSRSCSCCFVLAFSLCFSPILFSLSKLPPAAGPLRIRLECSAPHGSEDSPLRLSCSSQGPLVFFGIASRT